MSVDDLLYAPIEQPAPAPTPSDIADILIEVLDMILGGQATEALTPTD